MEANIRRREKRLPAASRLTLKPRTTMAFNKNSNGYTFLFAILMVVLVGAILAFTSLSLKPLQKANAAEKKMMNILGAIGVPSERGAVRARVSATFVTERVSIDSDGRQCGLHVQATVECA